MAKKKTEEPAGVLARYRQDNLSLATALGPGERISFSDLPRIKNPSGGATYFTLRGDAVKELSGIILHTHMTRSYWPGDDVTGEPPQCASVDAVTGQGDPGGECAKCPMAEWGSSPRGGRGQACKTNRLIYLLLSGELLPVVVRATPTSLAACKSYLLGLFSQQIPSWAVETKLTLAGAKNDSGKEYATLQLEQARVLEDEAELVEAERQATSFQRMFAGMSAQEINSE